MEDTKFLFENNGFQSPKVCTSGRFHRYKYCIVLVAEEKEANDDVGKIEARCFEILAHCDRRIHVDRGGSDAL